MRRKFNVSIIDLVDGNWEDGFIACEPCIMQIKSRQMPLREHDETLGRCSFCGDVKPGQLNNDNSVAALAHEVREHHHRRKS
jgi:hypothetical protein